MTKSHAIQYLLSLNKNPYEPVRGRCVECGYVLDVVQQRWRWYTTIWTVK
jgi:hypothetical protein